jgi:L-2,4-diaminobutyric acid acetyltransferase
VVETTITPSNRASKALFSSLARTLNAAYAEGSGFPERMFPDQRHEREDRVRIGPFDLQHIS